MRLNKLTIAGFRGFAKQKEFTFGATNIIGGPNGFGKTSMFDAIQWCLFGKVPRLSGTRDFTRGGDIYRNLFSDVMPVVALEFQSLSGGLIYRKRFGGECSSLIDGRPVTDHEFFAAIAIHSDVPQSMFLRNYLLQQETINQFVRELNPRERYDSMLYLLNDQKPRLLLDRLDNLFMATQSDLQRENIQVENATRRVKELESDISDLESIRGNISSEVLLEQFDHLLSEAGAELLASLNFEMLQVQDVSAVSANCRALIETLDRTLAQVRSILAEVRKIRPGLTAGASGEKIGILTAERLRLQAQELESRQILEGLDSAIRSQELMLQRVMARVESESRLTGRAQTVLAEIRELISADLCPVCLRPMPLELLKQTIEKQIGSLGQQLSNSIAERSDVEANLNDLRSQRDARSQAVNELASKISGLTQSVDDSQVILSSLARLRAHPLISRWGLDTADIDTLDKSVDLADSRLEEMRQKASNLLSQADRLKSVDLLSKKNDELRSIRDLAVASQQKKYDSQRELWRIDRLKDAINKARSGLVSAILESYKPIIQSLYSRFRVHSVFSEIDFEVVRAFKDTELYFRVFSPNRATVAYPPTVFSASQLNALAVSIFLALNLRSPGPFEPLLLDDPVQAMDDINVLGFCEILRQLKPRRQIFVATHSRELYQLLRNKLRPNEKEEPLRAFWFSSWSSEGPVVHEEQDEYLSSRFDLNFVAEIVARNRKAS